MKFYFSFFAAGREIFYIVFSAQTMPCRGFRKSLPILTLANRKYILAKDWEVKLLFISVGRV
jgi:hypothetical protein